MFKKIAQPSDQLVPYQTCLRAIGAELDARDESQIRIFEVPDGFDVTSVSNGGGWRSHRRLYAHEELLARNGASHRQKPRLLHKHDPAPPPSPYQDLFRAIGYELMDAGAYLILLDELEDGFLLTYQYYDASSGFMLHKRQVHLKHDDTRLLLHAAIGRRSRR